MSEKILILEIIYSLRIINIVISALRRKKIISVCIKIYKIVKLSLKN